jgi:transcription elongation factor Elf1
MSNRTCPRCNKVCDGFPDVCIGPTCGSEPCGTCEPNRSLAAHKTKTKKEYYQFFADGPEDAARILQVIDDDKGAVKAFPGKDKMVWLLVDKQHELYLTMDPELAALIGAQMLIAAGVTLTTKKIKEKEK